MSWLSIHLALMEVAPGPLLLFSNLPAFVLIIWLFLYGVKIYVRDCVLHGLLGEEY
jgi:hypothetical protein